MLIIRTDYYLMLFLIVFYFNYLFFNLTILNQFLKIICNTL